MLFNYGTSILTYRFKHEPDYIAPHGTRPRGVHGRTSVSIQQIQPNVECPFHFNHIGDAAVSVSRDECTCTVLNQVTGYAYCSKKEPELRGRSVKIELTAGRTVVRTFSEAYDPAVGRLEAFKNALLHHDGTARPHFSPDVRRVLWRHFLTTCKQPILIPARPQRRIYRKLTLDEAEGRPVS